jgi:hypothetical protein
MNASAKGAGQAAAWAGYVTSSSWFAVADRLGEPSPIGRFPVTLIVQEGRVVPSPRP